MRIVGGSLVGRVIKAPKGRGTRPTSDKVREAVFNILEARGESPAEVLDLYAGSGACGIEAHSRGAAHVTFVELDSKVLEVIRSNLETLNISNSCTITRARVTEYLRREAKG